MNNALFVTATDTGVGKTLVCGCLLHCLQDLGRKTVYQKWVASGLAEPPTDLDIIRRLAPAALPDRPELHLPYGFAYPASPHLAARMAGGRVEAAVIARAFAELRSRHEVVVEGVGGVLVPLNDGLLLADLLADCRPPTLVVARSGLGTINHTLLTLEALRGRGIEVVGVVCSDERDGLDERIVADNMTTVASLGRVPVFGRLRRHSTVEEAATAFMPLAAAIVRALGWLEK
ncbi:MAG: dethiobiotin synthase [Thermodesulfobacteriota bacterium]